MIEAECKGGNVARQIPPGDAWVLLSNGPATRLNSIEAARGFAALAVLLYHATEILAQPKYLNFSALGGLFNFGHAGVDFFFVLSGFIIAYVHGGDVGVPKRRRVYAWRRFARIYPTYWVACALVLAALAAGAGPVPPAPQLLANFALIADGSDGPFIGVAWSLQHEVLFYLLFGILIWRPTFGICLFAIWLGGILAAAAGAFGGKFPLNFIFHSNNLEFFFGIAGTFVVARNWLPRPGLIATLGALAFLASGIAENIIDNGGGTYVVAWRFCYGLSATVVITGLAQYELAKRPMVPKILVFLGAASYAVYLVHQTVMSLLCHAFVQARFGGVLPGDAIWLLLVIAVLALSVGFYLAVDRPLGRLLHDRTPRRGADRAAQSPLELPRASDSPNAVPPA